ncbi:hypothetical protein ACFFNY_15230 [Paenibacillus hodogayensis]|uniref:YfhD family protein n=1 Tax=Paenibacillus hodogayensis TaxID=279208 RepID=A0ABV5VY64_9BACL
MEEKQDAAFQPNLTNYDFIWGSDQDQYLREEEKEPLPESDKAEREEDHANE